MARLPNDTKRELVVIEFRRGDPDAVSQWSKGLARGKQLMAIGKLATIERVPGAEEVFTNIAYTIEPGIPGEEKSTKVWSWHNMYATYYLIGPAAFMEAVSERLETRGVSASKILVSLETETRCGVGICGACEAGGRLLCLEGTFVSASHARACGWPHAG